MITDIATVIWKEWKEIFLQRGSVRSGLLNLGIIFVMVGIFFPLQTGREWLTNPAGLATWAWLPLFLTMGVVADAFAGERERHTLETLLASRLPDRAILFGKIGAAVLYGWFVVLLSMLVGAVTVNVAQPAGGLVFYPLGVFVSALTVSLLATILMAGIGVLVSLHSSTTRQAYQRMSVTFMIVWFVPILALQFLPKGLTAGLFQSLVMLNIGQVILGLIAFLLVADVILIYIAVNRFQRARLILD